MKYRERGRTGVIVLSILLILIGGFGAAPAYGQTDSPTSSNDGEERLQGKPLAALPPNDRRGMMFPGFNEFISNDYASISLDRLNGAGTSDFPPLANVGETVEVGGWLITPLQYEFIPGQAYTSVYFPATGQYKNAPNLVSYGELSNTAEMFFIPSDSSLVLVEFEVRSAGEAKSKCLLHQNFFLSAPGHATAPMINFHVESIADYEMVAYNCVAHGWTAFYSPGRTMPADLWLYAVTENGDYSLWLID